MARSRASKRALRYSHFSPLAGLPDKPENYHEVKIELSGEDASTTVSLAQDGNATDEARAHSAKNWLSMLESLKRFVERRRPVSEGAVVEHLHQPT